MLHHRPILNDKDKLNMAALAAQFHTDHLRNLDLPYRLSSWALDEPENTRLWLNAENELLGWAVLQSPFWTIDYTCNPQDAPLHREILAWANQRAAALVGHETYGRPCWFINAFADQADRIKEIEAAGFSDQSNVGENSWSKVWMRRRGKDPVRVYDPPPGYTVRPLKGEAEVEAYTDLHRSVFESKNMTAAWRRRAIQHPHHSPDLDVVVETPEKTLAAFCIGWISKRADGLLSGQIEPLGCHKEFRNRALGRVALTHVMKRLQSKGVEEMFLETDSYRNTAFRLYESVGFEVHREVLVFRKDYPAAE